MKKIVALFLIICGIMYALKSMDESLNNAVVKIKESSIDIPNTEQPRPSLSKTVAALPPIVESKTNVTAPAKIVKPKEEVSPVQPETLRAEKPQNIIEDGKKIPQQGQEVICDTYIPRCINFQYYFKDVPQDSWDQVVSCLSRYSNCVDQSKYEIPSDEEVMSIYQAPNNDFEYQEFLKRKKIERGESVEEYSY